MTRIDFYKQIIDKCNFEEEEITEDTLLDSMDDWDSLNFLTIISLFKINFDFTPNINQMRDCKSLKDILDLANGKYED